MIQAIVLISVDDFSDGRKIANQIQNEGFRNPDAVRKKVREKDEEADSDAVVCVYTLDQFMEACNEQEINLENYWVSYVKLTHEH